MDSNSTRDLAKLEEYSLALIDFFEKLPDHFFEDKNLEPPKRIIDSILHYSKSKISPKNNDTKLYRFALN